LRLLQDLPQNPEGVLPEAPYDNKVRDLVLDRILKNGINVEQTLEDDHGGDIARFGRKMNTMEKAPDCANRPDTAPETGRARS